MPKLHIDFHEGWVGDRVEVRVQDVLRYAGQPVTRRQIGFAGDMVVDVDADRVSVDVRVPARSIRAGWVFRVGAEHWVGLSLQPDGVRAVDQPAPFGYV